MWNGDEDKPCWGETDAPFVGFKLATIGLKKKIRRGESLEHYTPDLHKPQVSVQQVVRTDEDKDMKDDNKTIDPPDQVSRQARLSELTRLLTYLELHRDASFNQNETRLVYDKFSETDSVERDVHAVCHFFIASHQPAP